MIGETNEASSKQFVIPSTDLCFTRVKPMIDNISFSEGTAQDVLDSSQK
jgi:hypothetical protein